MESPSSNKEWNSLKLFVTDLKNFFWFPTSLLGILPWKLKFPAIEADQFWGNLGFPSRIPKRSLGTSEKPDNVAELFVNTVAETCR